MKRKVLLGLSSIFALSVLLSFGSAQFAFAQDDTPTLYDDGYTDFYEDEYTTQIYEDDLTETDLEGFFAVIMAQMFFIACFTLPVYIYMSYSVMKIGNKVGEENGWMAWIPLLNIYYMVKVADLPLWWLILFFVPFANIVAVVYVWMKMAERRGFESWWGVLIIVPIANFIVPGYLAFAEPSGSGSSSSGSSDEEMTLEEHEAKESEKPAMEEPVKEEDAK